jgi:hypothetical protein
MMRKKPYCLFNRLFIQASDHPEGKGWGLRAWLASTFGIQSREPSLILVGLSHHRHMMKRWEIILVLNLP